MAEGYLFQPPITGVIIADAATERIFADEGNVKLHNLSISAPVSNPATDLTSSLNDCAFRLYHVENNSGSYKYTFIGEFKGATTFLKESFDLTTTHGIAITNITGGEKTIQVSYGGMYTK